MKKSKIIEANRLSKNKVLAKLAETRAAVGDMQLKRTLKEAEDKLSVSSPVESKDVAYIDLEVLGLLKDFTRVCCDGVLTQRYILRVIKLLDERVATA